MYLFLKDYYVPFVRSQVYKEALTNWIDIISNFTVFSLVLQLDCVAMCCVWQYLKIPLLVYVCAKLFCSYAIPSCSSCWFSRLCFYRGFWKYVDTWETDMCIGNNRFLFYYQGFYANWSMWVIWSFTLHLIDNLSLIIWSFDKWIINGIVQVPYILWLLLTILRETENQKQCMYPSHDARAKLWQLYGISSGFLD